MIQGFAELDISPYKEKIQTVIDKFDPNLGYRALLILDIDQTVIDCAFDYFLAGHIMLRGLTDVSDLELPEEMEEGFVFRLFADCDGSEGLNQHLIFDPDFQEQMPLMQPEIKDKLGELANLGVPPALYLTARPNEVAEVTKRKLEEYECHYGAELITRDSNFTNFEEANLWKIKIIVEIAEGVAKKGGKVIILDDNLRTISLVEQFNQHGNIIPLLMDSWKRTPERERHTLVDWNNISEVIENALAS